MARKLEEEAGETKENKDTRKEKKEVFSDCTFLYCRILIFELDLLHEFVLLSADARCIFGPSIW